MKTNFFWSNFDADFLNTILASDMTPADKRPGYESDDPAELSSFVESISFEPDLSFVNKYRWEIEHNCFRNQPGLVLDVFGEKGETNYLSVLNRIASKTMGETLARRYIKALYRIGCNDDSFEFSDYKDPVAIDLEKSRPEEFPLYDFQQEAVEKLKGFVEDENKNAGLLVMPTGSGKTRTAVHFLLSNVIAKGYQVIWLAHRHMLLSQTADQFKAMAPMIKEYNPDAKSFRFICASGMHCTIKAATKKDDLMILSVQTAYRNLDYIKRSLRNKVFIVVDEGHHSCSPSWEKVIGTIRKARKNTKLLGLTATPFRFTEGATEYLQSMFEKNIIYNVSMDSLITKNVLAQPEFHSVDTGENFEPVISKTEAQYINRNGELPETVLNKIAISKKRNNVIVEKYLSGNYGKTLIFALNIIHAKTLTEELKKRDIKADCVYSGQETAVNNKIIKRFAEKDLQVLVNVNILSEGSDIPCINTVFLTRPTQSEALLLQMVGRGMRGTSAGGTEKVEIVDFCDKWEVFNNFLTVGDWIIKGADPEIPQGSQANGQAVIRRIPWVNIMRAYNDMNVDLLSIKGAGMKYIPIGWFELEDDGEDYTLLVFDGQQHGYIQIIKDRVELAAKESASIQSLAKKYYGGMCNVPREKDLEVFFRSVMKDGVPHLYQFKERNRVEPFAVAKRIKENKEDFFALTEELYKSGMAQHFFASIEEYRERIFKIINYNAQPVNIRIEELPLELIPHKMDYPYDIQELYKEVVNEMFNGTFNGIKDIEWTNKPCKSYYGCYYPDGSIRINVLLNSSTVNREAVKYVIYHELLHRDNPYHDKGFRIEEHRYPNYTDMEKILDVDFAHFTF